MIRTQIQLTEAQAHELKTLAAEEGRSMADLVREGVNALLRLRGRRDPVTARARALAAVGRFESELSDVAQQHDRHLDEVFGS